MRREECGAEQESVCPLQTPKECRLMRKLAGIFEKFFLYTVL
jgi:hypothetical protein